MQMLPSIPDSDVHLATLLGRGRHGSVFVAHVGTAEVPSPVALKIPHDVARAREEHDVLARFEHPNIVRVVSTPLSNGALVLEYCAGGTVSDRLVERRLTAAEVRRMIVQLVDALTALHAAGWIHGDVSPRNIAFREDGTPVLIDFTTARPADGAAIDEGTDSFTGPVRRATPALDTRALAATALVALGDERGWDRSDVRLRTQLRAVIERADGGDAVTSDMLLSAWTAPEHLEAGSSGLRTEITQSFGPDPREASIVPPAPADRRRGLWFVVALAIIVVGAVAGERLVRATPDRSTSPRAPAGELAATTLARVDARWDSETATLQTGTGPDADRWHVGRAGDLAAVGDWDCDGAQTLGIYRPDTGSWFAFTSWDEDLPSADPILLEPDGQVLTVAVDESGCATPRIE